MNNKDVQHSTPAYTDRERNSRSDIAGRRSCLRQHEFIKDHATTQEGCHEEMKQSSCNPRYKYRKVRLDLSELNRLGALKQSLFSQARFSRPTPGQVSQLCRDDQSLALCQEYWQVVSSRLESLVNLLGRDEDVYLWRAH